MPTQQYLPFQLGEYHFALPLAGVVAIQQWTRATPLDPLADVSHNIPVIDLHLLLLGQARSDFKQVVVIKDHANQHLAMLVEQVEPAQRDVQLQALPNLAKTPLFKQVLRVGQRVILLLDIPTLFMLCQQTIGEKSA